MKNITARQWRKIDLLVLIGMPILATIISLVFRTNLLTSTLLFFGLPAIYQSFRTKKSVIKALVFSSIIVFAFGIVVDHIGVINGVWITTDSISTFRFFGTLPIENPLWAFLYVYNVIIFYEHFLQGKTHKYENHNRKYFIILLTLFFTAIGAVLIINPEMLKFSYSYLIVGITVFLIPLILFLVEFPEYFHKFAVVAVYFIFLSLLNELTALQLNHWIFPGNQVIGWIDLFNLRFPFEEFFFFIMIGSLTILSYYEFFYDDRKDNKS